MDTSRPEPRIGTFPVLDPHRGVFTPAQKRSPFVFTRWNGSIGELSVNLAEALLELVCQGLADA
jgi:hypothetical protein